MQRRACLAINALLFICVINIYAAALPVANQLASYLNRYVSYSANFSQVTYSAQGAVMQRSQGRMWLSRPGRFRWEVTAPRKQLIIANQGVLWVYDVDLAQVTQQNLSRQGLTPGVLLTTPVAQLAQQFNVSMSADGWFQLQPRQSDANFTAAALKFNQGVLSAIRIVNPLGQTSEFTLQQVQPSSKPLSNELFQFKPPPGVDVLTD